jgi:hypothetical protein
VPAAQGHRTPSLRVSEVSHRRCERRVSRSACRGPRRELAARAWDKLAGRGEVEGALGGEAAEALEKIMHSQDESTNPTWPSRRPAPVHGRDLAPQRHPIHGELRGAPQSRRALANCRGTGRSLFFVRIAVTAGTCLCTTANHAGDGLKGDVSRSLHHCHALSRIACGFRLCEEQAGSLRLTY